LNLASGHRVISFDRIDSTNAEARRLAEQGERGPLWIMADEQTAGRGRLGRHWVSEPGNFYGTFLFSIDSAPAIASQIGFVAALAVREAAVALRPDARFELKWPNDVLMNDMKVCGLLSEIIAHSPMSVALGCGINLAHAPESLSYPVTKLGAGHAPVDVMPHLDAALSHHLAIWDEGRNFESIRFEWERHAQAIGQVVSINGQQGIFEGLAEDGSLRMKLGDGCTRTVYAGDVRMGAIA
jgi:BirA family transcriptional regulator, biotin operon repressor / biotin---[acetyl-CoA-carboxylase] ligase